MLNSAYKFCEQGQKYTVHHDYGIEDIKVVEVMMMIDDRWWMIDDGWCMMMDDNSDRWWKMIVIDDSDSYEDEW